MSVDVPIGRRWAIEELHAATAIYTSIHVVDALLDRLQWPECGGRLLDPSAGDGSFLLQALKRLDLTVAKSIDRVRGWEIHAGAAQEARSRIIEYLILNGWRRARATAAARRMVTHRDFLTDGPEVNEFRIIAGNPPYLRFQRLPDYFKNIYVDCIPKYARGDLLHSFLDWCARLLPADGAIGLVCSDRFLFNANAEELRRQMGIRVGISHLARLDTRSSFYRPKLRVRGTLPRIHPVEVILKPVGSECFTMTGAAISPDELGREEEQAGRTLGDIARVSLAPWLGPFGIFVVSADTARTLPGANLVPAVDTDDIDPITDELGAPTRYAIRTSREAKPAGEVDRHLRKQRSKMPERGRNRPYWVPPEIINLRFDRPSLLIPRIARRLRAIPLPAGILPINHNLSVASTDAMSLTDLRELLLREKSQAWIQRNAPRLESGYYSITTRLLRRLPI